MEGPRAARREEMASLRALTDVVFRKNMMDEYPQLFNDDNLENLRVCVEDGRCVSHVGMTLRDASLYGCRVRVCCIGAVSTHPDFRGLGLASACFDDAVRRAQGDGVDFMIVSGDRNLYRMRGCLKVGRDTLFEYAQESVPELDVTVETLDRSDLELVRECYRAEPVRFVRPPEDYEYALKSGFVMNRPCEFLTIREDGAFRGYVIARRPDNREIGAVQELAGDRRAILASLPQVAARYDLARLHLPVQRHDGLLRSLCEQACLRGEPRPASGTVKLINYTQLMERMRPRFAEIVGERSADGLRFTQEEERYGASLNGEETEVDRDTMTRMLFGTVESAGLPEGMPKRLQGVLSSILPLPTLWYGLNYV